MPLEKAWAIASDVVAEAQAADAPRAAKPPAALAGLSPRELEVLRLLADGRSNPEIAAALCISPKTVGVHVSDVLAKLDVPRVPPPPSPTGMVWRTSHRSLFHEDGR